MSISSISTILDTDIFYLVRLWLGCIQKLSILYCLEVPLKFVWRRLLYGGAAASYMLRAKIVIDFG